MNEAAIQRAYYEQTAQQYDTMHLGDPEHQFSLAVMIGLLDQLRVRSVLDVGSGTARVLREVAKARPDIRVVGVEPSAALREVAYGHGVPRDALVEGVGEKLPFADGEFDLVCEFGMLHHVPQPEKVVAEMLRVSRRAVFISDSNNFGQGRPMVRAAKQALHALGLWRLADLIKTRGKGYTITEGDGLAYSYSVFSNLDQVRNACASVHMINTIDAGPNLYRTSGHVAVLGVKR